MRGKAIGMVALAGAIGAPADAAPATDPICTDRPGKGSFGGSAACKLTSDLQIDGGVNWGLNRHTADVEVYGGVSARF